MRPLGRVRGTRYNLGSVRSNSGFAARCVCKNGLLITTLLDQTCTDERMKRRNSGREANGNMTLPSRRHTCTHKENQCFDESNPFLSSNGWGRYRRPAKSLIDPGFVSHVLATTRQRRPHLPTTLPGLYALPPFSER